VTNKERLMLEYLINNAQPCSEAHAPKEMESLSEYRERSGFGLDQSRRFLAWWAIQRMDNGNEKVRMSKLTFNRDIHRNRSKPAALGDQGAANEQ
jgi:hypothetical protein